MKTLNIPFFSQLDDSVPEEHKRSVCALACTKMILNSRGSILAFEDLYTESQAVGHKECAGWTHETIIRLLRNHKVLAYRQEFLAHSIDLIIGVGQVAPHTEDFVEKGITKIKKSIDENNPVIVSVKANFSNNKEDHMVLVVGYENDTLITLDPILNSGQNPLKVSIEEFKKFWKKFAIFVE